VITEPTREAITPGPGATAREHRTVDVTAPMTLDDAVEHIATRSLRAAPVGRVGLELEFQLVDLQQIRRRPAWEQSRRLAAEVGPLPHGSAVTCEPGGQLELSTPPMPDVVSAVRALATDRAVLGGFLTEQGYAAVPLGADPLRTPRCIDARPRYAAMRRHYAAMGYGPAGTAMMSATAALQLNLEAGPVAGWDERFAWITALGPLLMAISAGSPYLGGRSSGWVSMRQECWYGMDPHRTSHLPAGHDVGAAWAAYALEAPVLLHWEQGRAVAVTDRVPLRDWLSRAVDWRAPTAEDVDYHLTTLFPAVRPRGYLELRYLDALPDRWWPALAAFAVTLIDDPAAAAAAVDHVQPVRDAWQQAARSGLADPALARAARHCAEVAADHAPPGLHTELAAFCEAIHAGWMPVDELRTRIERAGPAAVLEEEAHASRP
jgi:glutamate--cysteine ligase